MESKIQNLATKEDLFIIKKDLFIVKEDLLSKISESKVDMIKWMFIFWVGQVIATFGFILLFLKN